MWGGEQSLLLVLLDLWGQGFLWERREMAVVLHKVIETGLPTKEV